MTAAGVGASALGATMLTNGIRVWWIGICGCKQTRGTRVV